MLYRLSAAGVETRTVEAESVADAVREFNTLNGTAIPAKMLTVETEPFAPVPVPDDVPFVLEPVVEPDAD